MGSSSVMARRINAAGWLLLALTALHLIAVNIATSTTSNYTPRTSYVGVIVLGTNFTPFTLISVLLGIGQAVAYYLLLKSYRNRIFYAGILNGITIILLSLFNISWGLIYYISLYSNFALLCILVLGLAYLNLIRSQFRYFGTAAGLVMLILLLLIVTGYTGVLGSGGTENVDVYLIHIWGIAYGAYLIGGTDRTAEAKRKDAEQFNYVRVAGSLLLVSVTLLFIAIIATSSLYPTYSPAYQYIDELGLGSMGDLYNASLFLFGVAFLVSFYLVGKIYRSPFLLLWGALGGIGTILVSIFNKTAGRLELFWEYAALISMALVITYSARFLRRPMGIFSVAIGASMLASMALSLFGLTAGLGAGGIERMVVYPLFIWVAAFGAYLIGRGTEIA